jgi:hypothetical protein
VVIRSLQIPHADGRSYQATPKEPSDIDIRPMHKIFTYRYTLYCKRIAPRYHKPLTITRAECYLRCGKLHQQHKQTRCTEFSQKEETGGIVAWSRRHEETTYAELVRALTSNSSLNIWSRTVATRSGFKT